MPLIIRTAKFNEQIDYLKCWNGDYLLLDRLLEHTKMYLQSSVVAFNGLPYIMWTLIDNKWTLNWSFSSFFLKESQFSKQPSGSKGSWFSRQSSGVKALVIVFPLLVVILLVLALALFCYKKRKGGTRFLIDIFPGRDKSGMRRLSNDQLCNEL